MLSEQSPAPDFTLMDQDSKPFNLSSLKGKKIILYFYPKDDTPGCTKEACSLRDSFSDIRHKNSVVVGVSPDSPQSHQKFISKYHLPFTLLSDPEKEVMKLYGAYGEKKMYGKISVGVLRTTFIIDENFMISKVIKKVDTAEHGGQVLPLL